MDDYKHRLTVRNQLVGGVGPWHWRLQDYGAWDGPSEEFGIMKDQVVMLTPGRRRVCVQAGGCQGMYPRLWSQLFERVYTFEPDALNFHTLCLNNQTDRVVKFNCALGQGAMVGLNQTDIEWNTGLYTVEGAGHIPAIPLDSLCLDACDYIQLDVEGYEAQALAGGIETIRRHRPVISVETYDNNTSGMLEQLGYVVHGRYGCDTFLRPT